MSRLVSLIALFCMSALTGAAEDARIISSAAKSVALLQNVAAQWKNPCISCHHQAMPLIALETARLHGIPVQEPAAQSVAERTFRYLNDIDVATRIDPLIDPALFGGYSLLAAHAAGVSPSLTTALYARQIARMQQPDGSWPTFDARPPHSAGLFVATAVALRGVDLYLPESRRDEKRERLNRARRWLQSAVPESTEDLTYRLIGLGWAGAGEMELRGAAKALAALQKPDGGWTQVPAMTQSDAYSTAQVLVALRRAGIQASDPRFHRGIEWLLKSQAQDGSWHVKSRIKTPAPISPPYFESGFPYGHDQYVSCAATAWAVMALSEALPLAKNPARPLPLRGIAPAAAAWMHTAAFGTAAEVSKLDPNLSTPGGTTVLMLASDNADKVRALLEKGAKPAAAAKSGHDALMVASLFGGNRESLRLLLNAGATAKARPRVRFDAAPLEIATFTGDVEMVRFLIGKGADVNHSFRLLGQIPVTPLAVAAQMDYAGIIRELIKSGAKLDVPDQFGMTELSWAALNHKDAAVRALLESGARPGVKDKFGLTPLGHTKGVEYSSDEAARLIRAKQ
jgi:ankyrin repeat protein